MGSADYLIIIIIIMLCTNTLRKVMTQQPLTAKVLIKLKPYATLKFWQIRACNVLEMRVDLRCNYFKLAYVEGCLNDWR